MFKLHPAIVHFPVALLLLAGLCGGISLFVKREFWKDITIKCLIGGIVFTPLAVISGLIEEQNLAHSEAIHKLLMIHKYNGIAILFLSQILALWIWFRKKISGNKEYIAWVLCLLFISCMVMLQGYLGGEMVYAKGAGVKPMEESMGDEKSGGHGDHSGGDETSGEQKTEAKDSTKVMDHKNMEGEKKEGDDMKGMDHSNMDKNNKESEGMKEMDHSNKDKNHKESEGMKEMDHSNKDKNHKESEGMKEMDHSKMDKKDKESGDMNAMDHSKMAGKNNNAENMKDMDHSTMNEKKNGMEGMSGMEMKSALDTFLFEDNNPARKPKREKSSHK